MAVTFLFTLYKFFLMYTVFLLFFTLVCVHQDRPSLLEQRHLIKKMINRQQQQPFTHSLPCAQRIKVDSVRLTVQLCERVNLSGERTAFILLESGSVESFSNRRIRKCVL